MTVLSNQSAKAPVQIGAYLHSRRDLYRVEAFDGEYALMEDCRSGDLIDMPLRELRNLEPVARRGRRPAAERTSP
jgi:hypothetical protein